MILFVHNRYRQSGGEERAVENLLWLVREHLGEEAELLTRDSALLGRRRAAAGMLRGGLSPQDVAHAVRRTRARVVHAHNLQPSFGWRALAASREAGARVVGHLHQYRSVCAVGICFTHGRECTRCHGRNTLPGVLHNCRGSAREALVYAAALSLWQERTAALIDAAIVPSEFALARLRELGAPLGDSVRVLPHPVTQFASASRAPLGAYALFAGRLEPDKGLGVAVAACAQVGIPLVVAGEGSQRAAHEGAPGVTFAGRVDAGELARLRAGARLALMPSLTSETFGLAAAESMAAGLPVAASDIGALGELVPREWLSAPGDAAALARTVEALAGDPSAGEAALRTAHERLDPARIASTLAAIYS
ncbi:MAG TPA: glycosyltransferase family 4 protein [Solirubrobacteraceae bacterium]|nr:glycosyltransferase family 4 protein [Solirubrobacteraceae bacterium]